MFDRYKEWKAAGKSRKEFLEMAADIPGLYVPSFYDVTYKEDGTIEKPADPQKEGYKFAGWYYNGELWDFDEDIPNSNITLEAKWISNNASITIKGPDIISLDESYTYTIEVENIEEEFEMEWSSEDETIAEIDSRTGTIEPIKEGTVFINIKIKAARKIFISCSFYIIPSIILSTIIFSSANNIQLR